MDKDLARHVATVAFKSAVQLSDLLPMLKEYCEEFEYKTFLKAIATANATIHLEVGNKVFAQYPDIEQDFEQKIKKYGKPI